MTELNRSPIAVGVARLGSFALGPVLEMGRMALFLLTLLVVLFWPPVKFGRIVRRTQFIGFQSILLIMLTGTFTGMVLAYQGYYVLNQYGSTAMLGPLVALSLLRELGPVLCALMVTARVGSAITAEVGIMRISEEIDALEMMGLNPFRYLVTPVFLGALICLPLLTALFDVVGIGGGYLVGVKLLGVSGGSYMGQMIDFVDMEDVMQSVWKSLVFGGLIAWVSCYKGYTTEFGAEGVSRATTHSVVLSAVLILVSDYFLTSVMF